MAIDLDLLADIAECDREITHILLGSPDDTRVVRYEEYAIESGSQLRQSL